jgi:hypothetical protein
MTWHLVRTYALTCRLTQWNRNAKGRCLKELKTIQHISLHVYDERYGRLLLTIQLKIASFTRNNIVDRVIWTWYICPSLAQKQTNGLYFRQTSWKSTVFSNCVQSGSSLVVLMEPKERSPLPKKPSGQFCVHTVQFKSLQPSLSWIGSVQCRFSEPILPWDSSIRFISSQPGLFWKLNTINTFTAHPILTV